MVKFNYVCTASVQDAIEVGSDLRYSDYNELYASSGRAPLETALMSFSSSVERLCYRTENHGVVAIWGVAPAPFEGVGVPWMVATPKVKHYGIAVVRLGKKYTEKWQNQFPLLVNFVDARHSAAHSWLKRCGYKFIKLHPKHGTAQIPFYEFVRIYPCVTPSPLP